MSWQRLQDSPWYPSLRGAFFCVLWLLMASQLYYYLTHPPAERLLLRLGLLPLAGGLAAATAVRLGLAMGRWTPEQATRGWQRVKDWYRSWEAWLFPGLAFGLFSLFVLKMITHSRGLLPKAIIDAPWDVAHYRWILLRGYGDLLPPNWVNSSHLTWFPGLPLLGRLFYLLGLDHYWALTAAAWLAALAAFYLLFLLARRLMGPAAARWTLAALACYPWSFFLLLGFPYGLALALAASYALALYSGRPALAGGLGLGLSLTYPTAAFNGLLALFHYGRRVLDGKPLAAETGRLVLATWGLVAGPLALFSYFWLRYGDFFIWFKGQGTYNRAWDWPWLVLERFWMGSVAIKPEILVAPLLVAALAVFAHRLRPGLWALMLTLLAVSPASGTLEASYRHYLMAWPFFLLLGGSPRSRLLKFGFLWLCLYLMAAHFLPTWVRGLLV